MPNYCSIITYKTVLKWLLKNHETAAAAAAAAVGGGTNGATSMN